MAGFQHQSPLCDRIREALCGREEVLFAYLYGSRVSAPDLPGADVDVAVCISNAPIWRNTCGGTKS